VLGPSDRLHTWARPKPKDIKDPHPARHAALPAELQVRVIAVQAATRGHRPEAMYFATTLRDAKRHSAEQIAALYLRRWEVELFFDDIKTSQSMDTLRCQSPDMLARELLMHMIAHNLVRMLMVQADKRRAPGEGGALFLQRHTGPHQPMARRAVGVRQCQASRRPLRAAPATHRRRCGARTAPTPRAARGQTTARQLPTHDPAAQCDAPFA